MRIPAILAALACSALVAATPLRARTAGPSRPDLADVVQGNYTGDVISDSRGSSQSGVTIAVAKVGPGAVMVSSSYRRLPPFTVHLTRAMQTIQQANGDNVFLVDQSKSPWSLDVTVDGASFSGVKR